MKLKRFFSLILGTALALSLVACGSNDNPVADNSKSDAVQPPSNYVDCGTLEEAIEMAGIEISIPEVIKGYDDCTFRANKTDGMIEVIFQNDDNEIRFRKGLGDEDISGDYNEYAQTETVDGVTLKGADGQFSLALWTNGEYTYSISVGSALSQTDMMALVGGVK